MYNKHMSLKIEYHVVIDNKVVLSFNTEKKREQFMKKLNGTRKITCITDVQYPWNIKSGFYNLV